MINFKVEIFNPDDHQSFYSLIDRNRERLVDFFAGTVKYTETLEDTKQYCSLIRDRIQKKSYFPYIIQETDSGSFIGLIDIKNIDWSIPKAEVGYFIDHDFEGRGVITKAMSDVITQVIKSFKFKKLYCRISPKNIGSMRIVEKHGFEHEGTLRREYKTTAGIIEDMHYFGRLFDNGEV